MYTEDSTGAPEPDWQTAAYGTQRNLGNWKVFVRGTNEARVVGARSRDALQFATTQFGGTLKVNLGSPAE